MPDPPVDKPAAIAERRAAKDAAGLLPFLASGEALAVRRLAAEALAAIGDGQALEALGGLMARPEQGLSEHVLGLLAAMPGANAARLIARGLGAANPLWRNPVVETLAKRPEPEAVALLLPACRDVSGAIRQFAIRALRRILAESPERAAGLPPDRLDPVLAQLDAAEVLALFRSGPVSLRCAAARRLGKLGGEASFRTLAEACAGEWGDVAEAALTALEGAKAAPADLFRPLAGHASPAVRRRALAALAARAGAAARDALETGLADADGEVRAVALQELGARVGAEALERIAPLLADPLPAIRAAAVDVVARWPGERTTALLHQAAADAEEAVRWRVLLALARRGVVDPALAESYAKLLREIAAREKLGSDEVDGLCVIATSLGQHGGAEAEAALAALVAGAKSISLRLRRVAIEAIQRFPPGPRVEAFAQLVDTYDRSVLRVVGIALGLAGDARAVVPLVRVVDECGGRAGDEARKLLARYPQTRDLDFLIGALKNRWGSVKRFGADGLREAGDPRAIDPLLGAMGDEDVEVQLAAVLALQKFAAETRVAERLIETIEYGDLSVRQAAVEALGEGKVVGAVPMLIRALGSVFLRARAEEALRKIGDRKGYLAVRRRKIREKYFKKKPPKPSELAKKKQQAQKAQAPRLPPRLTGE